MQTDHPDLVPRLWTAARAMFARMRDAIGEAASIAARAALSREERRVIRKWLAPLEAMARKVVLIHALELVERGDTHPRAARAGLPALPAVRACHPAPAAPPAVTLIALPPPPVRILTHAAAAATAPAPRQHARAPALRLWPRTPAPTARARDVGPNLLVRDVQRDRARLALARQLDAARRKRTPEPQRLARRIDALARILNRPLAAARRLVRVLRTKPMLAMKLAMRRLPRTRLFPEPEYAGSHTLSCNRAYDFNMKQVRDTS